MNIRKERHQLRLTTRELAKEAQVASSTISRIENGEPTYHSTRKKVVDTIKRIKNETLPVFRQPERELKDTCRIDFGRGRRRPDIVRARRLLGINQQGLAAEFRIGVHEISKIECGYAAPDKALEMQVETFLHVRLEEKGLPWPVITEPAPDSICTPNVPDEKITINFKDKAPIQVDGVKMWNPGPTTESAVNYKEILDRANKELGVQPCSACKGTRIVWNPNTGQPYKCPFCGV
jgi:ribosome-binding protein aMBF1 (putative translation factor)